MSTKEIGQGENTVLVASTRYKRAILVTVGEETVALSIGDARALAQELNTQVRKAVLGCYAAKERT